jgi:hypothetical protein
MNRPARDDRGEVRHFRVKPPSMARYGRFVPGILYFTEVGWTCPDRAPSGGETMRAGQARLAYKKNGLCSALASRPRVSAVQEGAPTALRASRGTFDRRAQWVGV